MRLYAHTQMDTLRYILVIQIPKQRMYVFVFQRLAKRCIPALLHHNAILCPFSVFGKSVTQALLPHVNGNGDVHMIEPTRIENHKALCAASRYGKDILVAYLNGLAVKLGFEVFVNLFGLSRFR